MRPILLLLAVLPACSTAVSEHSQVRVARDAAATSEPASADHAGTAADVDAEDGEETDAPDQAMAWRLLRWRDENGNFDPRDVLRAHQQRAASATWWATVEQAGVGPFSWTERGPFNIGGRTRSLVINPADPNELWAGSVGGGIWHSTNGGASWTPVDDRLGNLAVCSLAIVAGTPPVLYAGTGEGFYNGDGLVGVGIFKSVDGGATFQLLPGSSTFTYTNRIAVHPTNPNILLAAVRPNGIYRSTNAGISWSLVRQAAACLQVLFDPNDPNKCVADIYDNSLHRVAYSTNAGQTWNNASSGLIGQSGISGRIELCYAAATADMVYASCGTGGGLIWRSTDGGANWTQRTTGSGSGAAWYYNSLWVDPTDSNFLVTGAYHIYKSLDGGTTLSRISNGYINTSAPHPDVHQFVADPGFDGGSNRRLYVTTDGGVYASSDIRSATTGGATWSRKDQSYRASQFYGAAGDGNSGRINGGTQDNGSLTLQTATATSARLTYGGDGGFAAIDWLNPNYIYGEYVHATMHRSSNGGNSASSIYSGLGDANSGSTANFIAPFLLDPNDPTRLLVGGASLWRTSDARASPVSWSAIKPAVGSNISAIAVAPGNANVIWVGHNNGSVYRTGNGLATTPSWTAVDDNGGANPLPNRYVTRILIDRQNSSVVYVALGGFAGNNLWRTSNGVTFVDRTGTGVTGLPSAPVNGLCQHPSLPGRLYAGTEVGLFASEDDGATWSTSNEGPADVSIEETVFMANSTRLLLATHGRGLWTIDVREPAVSAAGNGCAGSNGVPALAATLPHLGQGMSVTCSSVVSGAPVWLALGFSNTQWGGLSLPIDLGIYGMPGCQMHTSIDLTFAGFATGTVFTTTIPIPPNPTLVGADFYLQALAIDPAANALGATVSDALQCSIGN